MFTSKTGIDKIECIIECHYFSTVQFMASEEIGKKEMLMLQKSSFIYIDESE